MVRKITFVIFVLSLLIFSAFAFAFGISPVSAQTDLVDMASQSLSVNHSLPTNQTLSANQTAILGTLAQRLQTISTNQTELQQIINDSLKREYLVHVLWEDDTSGNEQVNYKRAGGKFDPAGRIDLSTNDGDSRRPAIATQSVRGGSNVYIVWSDNSAGTSEQDYNIIFLVSRDGGATFSHPRHISTGEGRSELADIAAVRENIYIVWQEADPTGNYEVYFSESKNEGFSFSAPINLSNNLGNSMFPVIAATANNVHVVWGDNSLGNSEIVYRKSTDNGATFGSTINVSNSPESSTDPDVAVGLPGGGTENVYVVWTDYPLSNSSDSNIRFIKSEDIGDTFENRINITSSGWAFEPALAADRDKVYITHVQRGGLHGGNTDIEFVRSLNEGDSFSLDSQLSLGPTSVEPGHDRAPAIAAYDEEVYVVWHRSEGFQASEILFRMSTTSGERWQHFTTDISNSRGSSDFPAIAVRPIFSIILS